MTHKDESHSSQIKCNLLRFSVVFLGSAYENDNLRPKISKDHTYPPTMDKYQKMLQNWVISSLICIEIKKKSSIFEH